MLKSGVPSFLAVQLSYMITEFLSAGPKHSEILLDEWGMVDCKLVVSPGCTEQKEGISDVDVFLSGSEST